LIYVAAQSGLSTTEIGHDPCSELRYTQASAAGPRDSCGKLGAPAPRPDTSRRRSPQDAAVAMQRRQPSERPHVALAVRRGGHRRCCAVRALRLVQEPAVARRWCGRGAAPGVSYKDAQPGTTSIAGISILKQRGLGGITATT
jgi:hypothetical protein